MKRRWAAGSTRTWCSPGCRPLSFCGCTRGPDPRATLSRLSDVAEDHSRPRQHWFDGVMETQVLFALLWTLVWLLPLLGCVWLISFTLSMPLRRRNRAELF